LTTAVLGPEKLPQTPDKSCIGDCVQRCQRYNRVYQYLGTLHGTSATAINFTSVLHSLVAVRCDVCDKFVDNYFSLRRTLGEYSNIYYYLLINSAAVPATYTSLAPVLVLYLVLSTLSDHGRTASRVSIGPYQSAARPHPLTSHHALLLPTLPPSPDAPLPACRPTPSIGTCSSSFCSVFTSAWYIICLPHTQPLFFFPAGC